MLKKYVCVAIFIMLTTPARATTDSSDFSQQFLQFQNEKTTTTPLYQYQSYVKQLGTIIYYWAYPLVDIFGRSTAFSAKLTEPGLLGGLVPIAPFNTVSCLANYLPATQRWIVSANQDTLYGNAFADLSKEPVIVQTPIHVPPRHYWTIQIADAFSNVVYQLGSRDDTQGGKYLLVGPSWKGTAPPGFNGVLYMPTNLAWIVPRSFMVPTEEGRKVALDVLNEMSIYPFSQNEEGSKVLDCESIAKNKIYPPNLSEKELANHPEKYKPIWVNPKTFWNELDKALQMNPQMGANDQVMASQAKLLISLYKKSPSFKAVLDRAVEEANTNLLATANYAYLGTPVANGWRTQNDAAHFDNNWLGRAQAAIVYIMLNDPQDALYFFRTEDNQGHSLNGKNSYTITFDKNAFPPIDEDKGGFWSLTLYNSDNYMMVDSPNGRVNIGTKNLLANQLKYNADGSLTLYISMNAPTDPILKTNWLPAPLGDFSLLLRMYVPKSKLLKGKYQFPNVIKKG